MATRILAPSAKHNPAQEGPTVSRYGLRYWAVVDQDGILVCVTLYKRGAVEVARRLSTATGAGQA